ncbi:uncharacterized protein [Ptychodera flava]|uniref:uncharacterized protein isoform X3 n=1 Tax=Ptychodera flava TaxID=63121 RepID=UPI003969BE61
MMAFNRLELTSSRSDFEQDKCESAPNRMQQTDKRPECEMNGQSQLVDRPAIEHNRSEYTVNKQRHGTDSENQAASRQENSLNWTWTEDSAEKTEECDYRSETVPENPKPSPAEPAVILHAPENILNGHPSRPEDVVKRPEDVTNRPTAVLNRPEQEVDSPVELDSTQKELIHCVFQMVYDLVKSISCEVFLKVVDSDSNALVYGTNDFLNKYFDKGLHAHHKDVLIGVETDKFASKLKEKLGLENGDVQEMVIPSKGGEKCKPQVRYIDNTVEIRNALNNSPPATLRRTRRRKQPSPKTACEPTVRIVKRKRGQLPRGKNKKMAEKKVSHESFQHPANEQVSEDGSDDDEDTYDVPDDDKDKDYKPTTKPRAKRKYTFVRQLPRKAATPDELKSSTCEACGETFEKVQEFREHKKKHAKERLTCKECGKFLSGYTNLQQHIRIVHKKVRPFQCSVCEKTFHTVTHLTVHKETHATEEEKKVQCDKCGKMFTHIITLKEHVRRAHVEKKYQCETCGQNFSRKSNLAVHIRRHTGEKPFQCDHCGWAFTQLSSLQSHKFIHTGERPFKCSVCKYASNRADILKDHFRRNHGERPFQCEICDKRFARNQQLVNHKRHHMRISARPFHCETCDKRFSTNQQMVNHKRRHPRNGVKCYKCHLCGVMFFKSGQLKCHMIVHSGEMPFQCHVCDKKLNSAGDLVSHVKVHRKEVDGANVTEQTKKPKTPGTNAIESTTDPNHGETHMQMTISPQQQPHPNIPVNHQTQSHSEADRMYVEPLAMPSTVDALWALQHDHW